MYKTNKQLIVLLIDTSGSMSENGVIISKALNEFKTYFQENFNKDALQFIEISVIISNSLKAKTSLPPKSLFLFEKYQIKIQNGGDNTNDAILLCENVIQDWKLRNPKGMIPIVILLTDEENNSITTGVQETISKNVKYKKYFFWLYAFAKEGYKLKIQTRKIKIFYERKKMFLYAFFKNVLFDFVLKRQKIFSIKNLIVSFFEKNLKISIFIGFSVFLFWEFYFVNIYNLNITINQYQKIQNNISLMDSLIQIETDSLIKDNELVEGTQINVNIKFDFDKTINIYKNGECKKCDSLVFKYELIDVISDYELGEYHPAKTKATKISCLFLENKIEYLGTKYSFDGAIVCRIQGETDAVSIRDGGIPYKGEYGNINGEIYKLVNNSDSKPELSTIYLAEGSNSIDTNEKLAFMRAYGMHSFLKKEVEDFIINEPHFQFRAKTNNNKKGGNYRKIIVEIIFFNVHER